MKRNLRSEEEIISSWQKGITTPVISISCTTYNHEKFIEDTLEGFLIQETEYPFEIIIHDDASTDGTAELLLEYQKKYPKLIRTILQTENQYSKGRKPGEFLFPAYRGKYVANCEGDDYWTDPKKLQIQVDFLEKNPDYVISSHDAAIIDVDGNIISEGKLPESRKRDCSQDELLSGRSWILTLSRVYRREFDRIEESRHVKNGDTFFAAIMGQYGKSKYHHNIKPAKYRVHKGGIWSTVPDDIRTDDHLNTWFWMYRYFKRVGNKRYADFYYQKVFMKLSERAGLKKVTLAFLSRLIFLRAIKRNANRVFGRKAIHRLNDTFTDYRSKLLTRNRKK